MNNIEYPHGSPEAILLEHMQDRAEQAARLELEASHLEDKVRRLRAEAAMHRAEAERTQVKLSLVGCSV